MWRKCLLEMNSSERRFKTIKKAMSASKKFLIATLSRSLVSKILKHWLRPVLSLDNLKFTKKELVLEELAISLFLSLNPRSKIYLLTCNNPRSLI